MTAFRIRHNASRFLIHLTLAGGGALMLVPFFWLLSSSLKAPHEIFVFPPKWIPDPIRWTNYLEVFEVVSVMRYAANTMTITFFSTLGVILSSSMAAYSFARLRFKGRDIMFGLILSTVMLPYVVTMIPVYILFSRLGWIGTFLPLIVPDWFGGPITIFLLRQFSAQFLWMKTRPAIDGASRPRIFAQKLFFLSPVCADGRPVCPWRHKWNDFLTPLTILHKRDLFTLALGLNALQYFEGGLDWTHYVMALATLMVLPVVILYFLAQRAFVEGIVLTGLKG